ncbi:MAG: hypothetical protein DRI89_10250 [Bacteroidetes bacterium]|nr:MAG: hypothetical protein DRI89_10250 [Bacteroidota bacterium]
MDKNEIQYSLVEPLSKEYETLNRDELQMRLQVFIADLLENNFEKLCTMIYRHDVLESKFNRALEGGTIDEQAVQIALLVLEREMEKVETRRKYKRYKEENRLKGQNE